MGKEETRTEAGSERLPHKGLWVALRSARVEEDTDQAVQALRWEEPQWREEDLYSPFDHYYPRPRSSLGQESLHLIFAGLARGGDELRSFQLDLLVANLRHRDDPRARTRELRSIIRPFLALSPNEAQRAAQFARQWGVPELPPEWVPDQMDTSLRSGTYPLLRFSYLAHELAVATQAWHALKRGDQALAMRATGTLLILTTYRPHDTVVWTSDKSFFTAGLESPKETDRVLDGLFQNHKHSLDFREDVRLDRRQTLQRLRRFGVKSIQEYDAGLRCLFFMPITNTLAQLVKARLSRTRLGAQPDIMHPTHPFAPAWDCPDLLAAMWTMFYLDLTGGAQIAYCACGCGQPLAQTRPDMLYKPGHGERGRKRFQRHPDLVPAGVSRKNAGPKGGRKSAAPRRVVIGDRAEKVLRAALEAAYPRPVSDKGWAAGWQRSRRLIQLAVDAETTTAVRRTRTGR